MVVLRSYILLVALFFVAKESPETLEGNKRVVRARHAGKAGRN